MAADADDGDDGDAGHATTATSFRLLVRSADAPNDGPSTDDHEQDADGACDQTLGLIVGVDLAPQDTAVHEGPCEQACPFRPKPDHQTRAHESSPTQQQGYRTEKDEGDVHDAIIGRCCHRCEEHLAA
jgi:hypothetical protein